MNTEATEKLKQIQRISSLDLEQDESEEVLLYNKNEELIYKNDKIYTREGKCLKDLLRVIKITEPFSLQYETTNILVPRFYAEIQNPILEHISVQCLLFCKLSKKDLKSLKEIILKEGYNKTSYDAMWISYEKDFDTLNENCILYLMNRRVGGWDGSIEKPVIELLCAGGHLPTVWNVNTKKFETLSYEELLIRELKEELGISISYENFISLGGFHNEVSNELVVLDALFIDYETLLKIIQFSRGNVNENIDGIYLGIFEDVMRLYEQHPEYFAGGKEAKFSNFPSNELLMKKIKNILEERK